MSLSGYESLIAIWCSEFVETCSAITMIINSNRSALFCRSHCTSKGILELSFGPGVYSCGPNIVAVVDRYRYDISMIINCRSGSSGLYKVQLFSKREQQRGRWAGCGGNVPCPHGATNGFSARTIAQLQNCRRRAPMYFWHTILPGPITKAKSMILTMQKRSVCLSPQYQNARRRASYERSKMIRGF